MLACQVYYCSISSEDYEYFKQNVKNFSVVLVNVNEVRLLDVSSRADQLLEDVRLKSKYKIIITEDELDLEPL